MPSLEALAAVSTDLSSNGGLLYRDSVEFQGYEYQWLYIYHDQVLLPILDTGGRPAWFDYSYSGRFRYPEHISAAVAVESIPGNSGYYLARSLTDVFSDSQKIINWQIYSLDASGQMLTHICRDGSIKTWEPLFNQDLDLDGNIGFVGVNPSSIPFVETDPEDGGVRLRHDSNGQFYIDQDGVEATLDLTAIDGLFADHTYSHSDKYNTFSGSTWEVGVEKFNYNDTEYYLRVRQYVNTFNGVSSTEWYITAHDLEGRLVGEYDFQRILGFAGVEDVLNQDLDGDGIGVEALVTIAASQDGAVLKKGGSFTDYYVQKEDSIQTLSLSTGMEGVYGIWDGVFLYGYNITIEAFQLYSDNNQSSYIVVTKYIQQFANVTDVTWSVGAFDSTTLAPNHDFYNILDPSSGPAFINFFEDATDIQAMYGDFFDNHLSFLLNDSDEQSELPSVVRDAWVNFGGDFAFSEDSGITLVSSNNVSDDQVLSAAEAIGVQPDEIQPVTKIADFYLDFTDEIDDSYQGGARKAISIQIPLGSSDNRYLKQDSAGSFYDFAYDPATEEGAVFSKTDASLEFNNFLTLYIRDNGIHDSDPAPGVIRDPAFVAAVLRPRNFIEGTNKKDVIEGTPAEDVIYGLSGGDFLGGAETDDFISGGRGSDKIFGGLGDDLIVGGKGSDTLWGDLGSDLFSISAGRDKIIDFDNRFDSIAIPSGFDYSIRQAKSGAVVSVEGLGSLSIVGSGPIDSQDIRIVRFGDENMFWTEL